MRDAPVNRGVFRKKTLTAGKRDDDTPPRVVLVNQQATTGADTMASPFKLGGGLGGLFVIGVLVVGGSAGRAGAQAAGVEAPVGGMKTSRDPATGERPDPPAPGTAAPQPVPRRAGKPVESPGKSAAGGVKLDVRGYLQENIISERNADGTTTTRYVRPAPGGQE